MKIIVKYPPNYKDICNKLGIIPGHSTVYCWGDVIYNPSDITIPLDVIIHESVHGEQQGTKVEEWWDRYLSDGEFRLSQEIPAYHKQYLYLSKIVKGDALFKILHQLAAVLSGSLYNNMITYSEALKKIKYGS